MATVPVGYANPGDPYFVLTAEQISSIVTDILEILPGGAIINGWDEVQHAAIIFNKVTDGQNFVNLGIQNGLVPNPLLPGTSTLSKMLTVENDLLNYDFIGVSQVNLFGDGQVADPSRLAGVISGDGRGNVYVPNCLISSLTVSSILGFYPTVQIISTFSSAKIFNLTVSSINGTEYPPPPPPLVSTFSNIDVSSINGAAYPPITPVISTFSTATVSSLSCYEITNPGNQSVSFTNSFLMPTGTGFNMISPITNAQFVVSNPKTSAFEAFKVDSFNTELGAGYEANLVRLTAPSQGTYRFTFGINNQKFAEWDALDTTNSTGFPIIINSRPSTILQCSQISSFNTGNIQVSTLNQHSVPYVQYGASTFQSGGVVTINLANGYPDASYSVVITPTAETSTTPFVTAITSNSFTVNAKNTDTGIGFNWIATRNNF